jgi:hypothetical protein
VVDQPQGRSLRFAEIAEAHIEVEFSRRADPQNHEGVTDEATEGER